MKEIREDHGVLNPELCFCVCFKTFSPLWKVEMDNRARSCCSSA